MMAAILNSAILDSDTAILVQTPFSQTHSHLPRLVPNICQKNFTLIHSDSTWKLSWNLPSQPFCTTHLFWLQSDSNSFILTQLDDGSHLEFCHLGFSHFAQKPWTSLIHSDSTWWWQPSWILPCWIQTLPSWIQTPCYLLSDSLKNTLPSLCLWLKVIQSD